MINGIKQPSAKIRQNAQKSQSFKREKHFRVEKIYSFPVGIGGVFLKSTEEFLESIRLPLSSLEEGLREVLHSEESLVREINNHLLRAPGKRLRPALFLLSTGIWQNELAPFLPVALAIELIHSATLIHDDIVDQALLRRGCESLNARFGEHASVLAGDYLFAKAFKLLTEFGDIRVIREMARLVEEMSEGEIQQQAERYIPDIDEETYFRRISKKTARFFTVCAVCGGLVAGARPEEIQALEKFSFLTGLAFQIIDDILDFSGEKTTGKAVAGDLRQGVVTLPVIHLLSVSPRREDVRTAIACRRVDEQLVAVVREELGNCGSLAYARREAARLIQEAQDALAALPSCKNRDLLESAAHFILYRAY